MSELIMHRLGLEVDGPAPCKTKLANNTNVRCVGVIKALKVKTLGTEVVIDVFVMPTKGEGYPMILGRPWLMAMKAKQDWGTGVIKIQGPKGKEIRYNMKTGRQQELDLEASEDDFTSDTTSSSEEETSTGDSSEDSVEIMGITLGNPKEGLQDNPSTPYREPLVEESKLQQMLSIDLSLDEREDYLCMLRRFPTLFIDGYNKIQGVSVVEHCIKLKEGSKPIAQKLRRLGVIQQEALLLEVRKLLEAGFIYPVAKSKWVSPVVVTPKKNGKWQVCVDYKPLNAATKRDHFPLPFQDEVLDEVAGYECYTVCDGYSGCFQIRIAEEDQLKTTFITPWGCFAYRVMPFGLTNAPATFQRFVTYVFSPFFGKSI